MKEMLDEIMENKYNILITLNSSYFDFGLIFMNSLFDNNDMDLVDTIFIADVGLNELDKQVFESYDKVTIIESDIESDFNNGGTWGKGWQTAVQSKTKFLLQVLKLSDKDVMMIDSDCLITKSLHNVIGTEDIQVCDRSNENKSVPFLGSYIYIRNTEIGKRFVSTWIHNIENSTKQGAKESPALKGAVDSVDVKYIKRIDRVMVSCYNKTEYEKHNSEPFIIHFKGSSLSKDSNTNKNKRIFGRHGFDTEITKYMQYV